MPRRNTMKKKSPLERIKRKTIYPDDGSNCWLFMGSLNKGHGQIFMGVGERPERVHRISAQHYLGYDLNSELQVNHKLCCKNANCWNPDHLYIGDQMGNMLDRSAMGNATNQWTGLKKKVSE